MRPTKGGSREVAKRRGTAAPNPDSRLVVSDVVVPAANVQRRTRKAAPI